MITRVRIPSKWFYYPPADGPITYDRCDPAEVHGMADFTLGEGPCGKTVERLNVQYTVYGVVVEQVCTCTEMKEFVYPWHTITGRVEVTHG